MPRTKKTEEVVKDSAKKPTSSVKKPVSSAKKSTPAAKKPAAAAKPVVEEKKKEVSVVIKVGQRVRHSLKSHIEGEVIFVRNSEEGATIKMTVLCSDGSKHVVSAKEAVLL